MSEQWNVSAKFSYEKFGFSFDEVIRKTGGHIYESGSDTDPPSMGDAAKRTIFFEGVSKETADAIAAKLRKLSKKIKGLRVKVYSY